MKSSIITKMLLSVFFVGAFVFIMSSTALADAGWKIYKDLDYVNFVNNKYETMTYNVDSGDFYLSNYPPTASTYFQKQLSYEEQGEEGYEYKLVWRGRRLMGNTRLDGRELPIDGSWSPEYSTGGLILSWDGMSECQAEIDYIKIYRRNISKSPWVYQGEMNYNTNYYQSLYERRKWDDIQKLFDLYYSPPTTSVPFEGKELSFTELFQDGYEYKLEWRAKIKSGISYIDGRTFSTTDWSPEYTTYGLTLPWKGYYGTEVYIDYVKVYIRKIDVFSEASAYWEFENGLGKDSSVNANNGTISQVISTNEPGVKDYALKLNGTNNMIIPHSEELNHNASDFSVSFWYKCGNEVSTQYLLDKVSYTNGMYSGYRIFTVGNYLRAEMHFDGKKIYMSRKDTFKRDNQWHNLIFVYEDNVLKVYQDLDESWIVNPTNSPTSKLQNSAPLYIGAAPNASVNYLGSLDEIAIYNKALNYKEIADIYSKTPISEYENSTVLDLNLNCNIVDTSIYNNSLSYKTGFISKYEVHNDAYKNAAIFDGSSNIKVVNNSSLNMGIGDFSLSCWFKTTSTKTMKPLIDKRILKNGDELGYLLCAYGSNSILLQVADNIDGFYNYIYTGSTSLNDGKWHHVAVTIDRDNTSGIIFYIDGEKVYAGNATYREGSIDNTADLLIGGHCLNSSDSFIGSIDNVGIYNRLLTEKELKNLYGKKKWNYLLYMCGDNNVESQLLMELDDYESVDFEDDINILVLLDRIPGINTGYDEWGGTKLLKLKKDPSSLKSNGNLYAEVLKDYGELNMADPKNLEDFIIYCQNNYEADRTILSLVSHGAGINGIIQDDTSNNSVMSIPFVKKAIYNANTSTGKKIEILNQKACVMQMIEVLYELKVCADYIIGSEEETNGFSLDEYNFMLQFSQNTSGSTEDILDIYKDNLTLYTHSAVKTKNNNINPSIVALNNFTIDLCNLTSLDEISSAYQDTAKMHDLEGYIDLIGFAKNVNEKTSNQSLKESSQNLINVLDDFQYFYKESIEPGKDFGISIYFPLTASNWNQNKSWYKNTFTITLLTKWDEFLDKYYGM